MLNLDFYWSEKSEFFDIYDPVAGRFMMEAMEANEAFWAEEEAHLRTRAAYETEQRARQDAEARIQAEQRARQAAEAESRELREQIRRVQSDKFTTDD